MPNRQRVSDNMTSKEAIERVMAQEPTLTYSGFFVPFKWPREERQATFREMRERTLDPDYTDHFERACSWLNRQLRTKSLNKRAGSYSVKHEAEKEVGYISNGMFIAGAIACGFAVQQQADSPNAYLNISSRCYGSEVGSPSCRRRSASAFMRRLGCANFLPTP